MNEQTIKLVFGAAVAVGVAVGGYYATRKYLPIVQRRTAKWLETNRPKIRVQVKAWLHKNNLEETKLSDIYVIVDRVAASYQKINLKVYAQTKETGKVQITEEELTIEEFQKISPTEAEKVVKKMGKTSIMSQVM